MILASTLAAFLTVACAPSKVGELVLTGQASDITMTGTTIYTIGGSQILGPVTVDFLAIDATTRSTPAIRGFNTYAGDGAPNSIEVAGNYAYTATSRGLVIMDIVNRLSPAHLPTVPLPGVFSVKLRVLNGRAYVIGTQFFAPSRLYVVDVGNPANAKILGNYPEPSQVFYDLEVAGNTAYVASISPPETC